MTLPVQLHHITIKQCNYRLESEMGQVANIPHFSGQLPLRLFVTFVASGLGQSPL